MQKLADAWRDMWNDQPALAHDLLTDDARLWSGKVDVFDPITGPAAFADYLAAYQRDRRIRFTTRAVVADRDRLATTWDAALPDGSVRSGADVHLLRDGRVARHWTITGDAAAPATEPHGTGAATRAEIVALCDAWLPLWNGDVDLAGDLLTDDFRIWFSTGRDVRGRAAFADFVRNHRSTRPGLVFAMHGDPVVDVDRQTAAYTWTATLDGRELGGIDVFAVRDGRFAQVWSWTGTRPLTF
jgi:hypothetical protein